MLWQMSSTPEHLVSLDHYVKKTFFKTASLMANSCKAIAILGGQPTEVSKLAFDYGHHLGLAFQACPLCFCRHWLVQACSGQVLLRQSCLGWRAIRQRCIPCVQALLPASRQGLVVTCNGCQLAVHAISAHTCPPRSQPGAWALLLLTAVLPVPAAGGRHAGLHRQRSQPGQASTERSALWPGHRPCAVCRSGT